MEVHCARHMSENGVDPSSEEHSSYTETMHSVNVDTTEPIESARGRVSSDACLIE